MTQAANVRGQVWRPDGHPAAGAVVTLLDPEGAQVGSAATTAGGTYEVALPAAGRYLLVVAAPGHAPWVRYVMTSGPDIEMPVVLADPAPGAAGSGGQVGSASPAHAAPNSPSPNGSGHGGVPGDGASGGAFQGGAFQGGGLSAPWSGDAGRGSYPPPAPPATHVASAPPGGFADTPPAVSRPAAPGAPAPGAPEPGTRPGGAGERAPGEAPAARQGAAQRRGDSTAVAAQAALEAISHGRELSANNLYGLITALLAGRIELENDPASALARTAARIGGARGGDLAEGRRAAEAILTPLANQLLSEDASARHVRRDDAAAPENVVALLRPLIEALANDLETRTTR